MSENMKLEDVRCKHVLSFLDFLKLMVNMLYNIYIRGGPKYTAHFHLFDVKLIELCELSTEFYNFFG